MILFFLPNGLGDVLMAIPALKRLSSRHGADSISVVVASDVQKKIIVDVFGKTIKCFCRYDGRRFSQIRLLLLIIKSNCEIIYAPLVSRKFLNFIFFILSLKRVILPKQKGLKSFMNLHFSKTSLNTYPGHQVNYITSFVSDDDSRSENANVSYSEIIFTKKILPSAKKDKVKIAVGLSCGVRERHKIPKPHLFAQTINKLAVDHAVEVLVFGTSDDCGLIDEFQSALVATVVVTAVIDLSVVAVIQQLSGCDAGLVGTTGQGHMMAAAGLPLVIFSGVTNPYESGPYVERAVVVAHSYPCGPCYQEAYSMGCGKIPCMDRLDFNSAGKALSDIIGNSDYGLHWRDKVAKKPPISVKEIERVLADII